MDISSDITKVKELLYRSEVERLHLQQKKASLEDNQQHLGADVQRLQQQLAELHAHFTDSQQQCQQLSSQTVTLQTQLAAAVREYRANDIICCGLRDKISKLQQQLAHSQQVCKQQASEIATSADDMSSLRQCKADLGRQLSDLQEQHTQLQSDHDRVMQQLKETQLELSDSKQRWLSEHGDLACQIQAVLDSKQQLQHSINVLGQQLQDKQQQLDHQKARCTEFETEVSSVRDTVMVLAKTIGSQPKGHELPGHEDPIWSKLGPLGGVQHALEVVIKHVRIQETRLKTMKADMERLEDRARSESAQKTELQAGLYEVRGLYAKAIADRESLEAMAARAEAEKAAAEENWQRARAQAAEDTARLTEMQDSVMSLTKQVQQLLPLQPRCSAVETERDAAQLKLDRLQEQHDQLKRQLQQAVTREAELRGSLDTYKTEHMQLLTANAQLVEKCQGLNRRVQVLEISSREGNLAVGQLEATQQKLNDTQSQLEALSDSHMQTLKRLETAKAMLQGSSSGSLSGSAVRSEQGSRRNSRPTSQVGALTDNTPGEQSPPGSVLGSVSPEPQLQFGRPASAELKISAGNPACTSASSAAAAQDVPGVAAANSCSDGQSSSRLRRSASPLDSDFLDFNLDQEIASLPAEVAALMRERGLVEQLGSKRRRWQEMKVSMLSWFSNKLRKQLLQQTEKTTELEVQLLQQEADHVQQLIQQEQTVDQKCMTAASEARQAMSQVLSLLRQVSEGGHNDDYRHAIGDTGDMYQWLHDGIKKVTSSLQTIAEREVARADQIAARRSVAVQSDQPVAIDWLRHVTSLPTSAVAQTLHDKAIAEAIVRIYIRALHQFEAAWVIEQQQRQCRPGSSRGSVPGAVSVSGSGQSGDSSTLFDCMMGHYSQQQQQHNRQVQIQAHDASLWRDPQGPICRLLVSCRALTADNSKVALFCCLAGTHLTSTGKPWTTAHWQQFLLILHVAKRLVGGLWKNVLKDWASAAGARLPLQCAHDLLGNLYNASSIAQLERLPALLHTRSRLLNPSSRSASRPATAQTPAGSRPASAAVQGSPTDLGSPSPRSLAPGLGGSELVPRPASAVERGSVAAALAELVVDGPVGPAVDLDDLMNMLMQQFDTGLLPIHPLMEPRRLTDGALSNTSNAWGSAAVEAAGSVSGLRARLGSPSQLLGDMGTSPGAGTVSGALEGGDWNLLSSVSGVNSSAGWNALGADSAATMSSRAGMTSAGAGRGTPAEDSTSGLLPRLRQPDHNRRQHQSNTEVASAAASVSVKTLRLQPIASPEPGSNSSPVASLSQTGLVPDSPAAKVGFRDVPSRTSSISSAAGTQQKGPSRGGVS